VTEADYNYLYGLIRSREGELIDAARLRALVGMAGIDEIVQIYPESPFLDAFAPDLDEAALERAIASEQADLRWLIDRYAPEPALRELLLVPRDLYNLKVALRLNAGSTGGAEEAAAGADADADEDALYGPPGTRPVASIRTAVGGGSAAADDGPGLTSAGDIDRASRALAGCLERALGAFYAAGRNGQVLELAIDRLGHLFSVAVSAAADPEVGAVYGDSAAIAAGELLARGSAAGLPWEVARWGLLDLPSQADLEALYETPAGEWGSRLAGFSGVLRALLARISEGMETGAAVRAAQEAVARRIAAWRYAPPSFAFAVYYLCKKQADLAALRMICLAKLKGVAEDTISARVGGAFMGQAQTA
jgi:vacuolar-type H+-ATPase subunit C/Vma6